HRPDRRPRPLRDRLRRRRLEPDVRKDHRRRIEDPLDPLLAPLLRGHAPHPANMRLSSQSSQSPENSPRSHGDTEKEGSKISKPFFLPPCLRVSVVKSSLPFQLVPPLAFGRPVRAPTV